MAFFPPAAAIDEVVATVDHLEAGGGASLAPPDPLEEWVARTCVDVPPDMDEEEAEIEEDEDDEQEGDEKEENTERTDDAGEETTGRDNDDDPPLQAVLTERDNLWENGKTITYAFLGPAPLCGTPRQQKKVTKVLTRTPSTWTDYANVKFKLLPSPSSSPSSPSSSSSSPAPDSASASEITITSAAIVRIQFIKGTASWAHIGRKCTAVDAGLPTMNLGWIADDDNLSDTDRAVVLHEFGHILGLLHEHQSPAIGGVVTLKEQQVKEVFRKTKGWSEKQVDEQILRRYQDSELTNFTEFDAKSIMMYYMPKEMNNEGIDIAPNDALSRFDKAFAAVHYPFFGPHPPRRPDARIENALRVLGIAPDEDEDEDDPAADGGDGLLPLDEGLLPLDEGTPGLTEEEKAAMQRLAAERGRKLEDKEVIMRLYRRGDWRGIREAVRGIYAGVREERMKGVVERMRAMAKKPVTR